MDNTKLFLIYLSGCLISYIVMSLIQFKSAKHTILAKAIFAAFSWIGVLALLLMGYIEALFKK